MSITFGEEMMLAELLLLPFFLSMQTEKKNERRQKKKLSKALWKGCNRRKKIPGHLWQWPRRLYSRVSPIQSYFARHEVRRNVEDERPELRLWLPTKLPQPRKEKKTHETRKGRQLQCDELDFNSKAEEVLWEVTDKFWASHLQRLIVPYDKQSNFE